MFFWVREACCLNRQPWRWADHASPKRWLQTTISHGALTLKNIVRTVLTVTDLQTDPATAICSDVSKLCEISRSSSADQQTSINGAMGRRPARNTSNSIDGSRNESRENRKKSTAGRRMCSWIDCRVEANLVDFEVPCTRGLSELLHYRPAPGNRWKGAKRMKTFVPT